MTERDRIDAERYRWLREHWDAIAGTTWSDPAAHLDEYIDAAMAGVKAADCAPCR
jgi:hypothetical protein